MDEIEKFERECLERVAGYPDSDLEASAGKFVAESILPKYSYNFS